MIPNFLDLKSLILFFLTEALDLIEYRTWALEIEEDLDLDLDLDLDFDLEDCELELS